MPESKTIRLFSWNVNGLRSCGSKGFPEWLAAEQPDVLGLQETRALPEQLDTEIREPDGYQTWIHPAEKKGYSGVGLYSKIEPESVTLGGLDEERFDSEGRLIIADYGSFLFYTGYFPNGGNDLSRVPYKLEFSEAVLQHAEAQRKAGKSIVICGDVNTAHQEIDLANPKSNKKNTGFLPEERDVGQPFHRPRLCRHLPPPATRRPPAPTRGGRTARASANATSAGGSTTSSSPTICSTGSSTPGSTPMSWDRTTARSR